MHSHRQSAVQGLIFFFLVLVLVTSSYAFLGCLLFGKKVPSFGSLYDSTLTMALALCGMYDYSEIGTDALTMLYFCSYIFLSFFIMLNALLAIIVDA